MSLSPALKYGLLSFLYAALAVLSLHTLWPLLPEPGFAWSMLAGLVPGLLVVGILWLLRRREPTAMSGLDWVLLTNALLLWLVIAFQELPVGSY